jgi:hypothetical protein
MAVDIEPFRVSCSETNSLVRLTLLRGIFIMPRRVWILGLAVLMLACAVPARADLVISIGTTTTPGPGTVDVAQGGTGTIGLWLSSTVSSGPPDVFNEYGLDVQISGPNFLHFAPTASQDFVSYLNNSQYVFVQPFGMNNSFDWQNGITTGMINSVSYANDTFVVSDSTNDLSTVSMTSNSGYFLLATLIVSAPTNDVNVGDAYTLNLNIDSGNTFFDQFQVEGSGVTVDSVSTGQVMITAASVPEPSSIVIGLSATVILASLRRSRRFKAPPT